MVDIYYLLKKCILINKRNHQKIIAIFIIYITHYNVQYNKVITSFMLKNKFLNIITYSVEHNKIIPNFMRITKVFLYGISHSVEHTKIIPNFMRKTKVF